jgi:hypothetical protein
MSARFFFLTLLFSLSLAGWVINIIKIITSEAFSGEFIVRIIGIFVVPVGAVLGYF